MCTGAHIPGGRSAVITSLALTRDDPPHAPKKGGTPLQAKHHLRQRAPTISWLNPTPPLKYVFPTRLCSFRAANPSSPRKAVLDLNVLSRGTPQLDAPVPHNFVYPSACRSTFTRPLVLPSLTLLSSPPRRLPSSFSVLPNPRVQPSRLKRCTPADPKLHDRLAAPPRPAKKGWRRHRATKHGLPIFGSGETFPITSDFFPEVSAALVPNISLNAIMFVVKRPRDAIGGALEDKVAACRAAASAYLHAECSTWTADSHAVRLLEVLEICRGEGPDGAKRTVGDEDANPLQASTSFAAVMPNLRSLTLCDFYMPLRFKAANLTQLARVKRCPACVFVVL
ncbi:hypothetical protein BOTBODRAFT_172895 [Botryobasidium botryosum FD-172 SS1]|uniref:Uncharacterized protein n=1 Tax=Botryobasidium botryosum (strain FD-172 SS1) TaxID=930990 RepID=A0A067MZ52_BOTB1|nr:hypothetical protein BOTBODRAFT_172895 [Botryobasidium botryosum FD-172 SS1]